VGKKRIFVKGGRKMLKNRQARYFNKEEGKGE
jgi:hypothetical protein